MNKMFTAVAIVQLVQKGKIHLDDPLIKYLPDYPNKDLATKVTIQHLLTHTGGTGDFFGPEFDAHRLELRTSQDYVKLYGSRPLRFEPGTKYEYSNYGFLLLGLVIEKASGQPYYDYVRDHIYKPAGMTSTGSKPEDQPITNRSTGYTSMGSANGDPSQHRHSPLPRNLRRRRLLHRRRPPPFRQRTSAEPTPQRPLHRAPHHRQTRNPGQRLRLRLRRPQGQRDPLFRPRRRSRRNERHLRHLPRPRLRGSRPLQPRPSRRLTHRRLHRKPAPRTLKRQPASCIIMGVPAIRDEVSTRRLSSLRIVNCSRSATGF